MQVRVSVSISLSAGCVEVGVKGEEEGFVYSAIICTPSLHPKSR
jgi:hypothetical protein